MALSDEALVTVAEMQTYLNITGNDSLLETLINGWSARMREYCNTYFIETEVTEEHGHDEIITDHASGRRRLYLDYGPITEIDSIEDPAGNAIEATDYVLFKDGAYIEGHITTPYDSNGRAAYWTVIYTAGMFDVRANVSEAIKLICKQLVADGYRQRSGNIASKSVGDLSITYANVSADAMPKAAASALSRYRRNVA